MKHIAVVRTCALGDAVQCTPLLQQIKADEPDAKLVFFTSENVVPLFEGAAFVNEVIPLCADWLSIKAGRRGMLRAWWAVARQGPFDAMISLESTWVRNAGAVLVKAPLKAGLSFVEGRKPSQPFTHPLRISGDSRKATHHASQLYLNLWLGITGTADRGFGYDMRHLVAPAGAHAVRRKWGSGGLGGDAGTLPSEDVSGGPRALPMAQTRRICLAPGTGNAFSRIDTKQWPLASFIELGERLAQQGQEVVFVGGANDLERSTVPVNCTNLLGKTSVREIASMLHHSAALVGNDSGLFHLAQGVGCPALGLYGPTSPQFTGVFRASNARTLQADLPCIPCYQRACALDHFLPKPCCMSALSVERVLRELQSLL